MYANKIKCSGTNYHFAILKGFYPFSIDFVHALFAFRAINYHIFFIQKFWKYTFFKIQTIFFASDL
jgi:hypothetical protein